MFSSSNYALSELSYFLICSTKVSMGAKQKFLISRDRVTSLVEVKRVIYPLMLPKYDTSLHWGGLVILSMF
jgi:hypothetical protein